MCENEKMAALWKEVITVVKIFCFICLLQSGLAVRTKKKIYIDLKTQSACFMNLNATHQAGCTSETSGNVGVIHYIQSEDDFDWVLSKGPHSPYVALLNSVDFNGTNVRKLYRSSRVNGIMVINLLDNSTLTPYPPEGFSVEDSCPNDRYGLYSNDTDYKGCAKQTWNPPGTSLHLQDIGIPIFALSEPSDVDDILNRCFYPFNQRLNNQSRNYPLCAAEVKARMDGAVDTITCMRRSNRVALSLSGTRGYCDPLGDKNVVTFMKNPRDSINGTQPRDVNSVILVGAKLDSTSLFQSEYYAADTTVAGVVTMLAAAEALWKMSGDISKDVDAKDILFTFFQGETFDYIGSSRMVYDMEEEVFPFSKDTDHRNINLTQIDQIVELNQVGLRDDKSLWAHTDPQSRSSAHEKIIKMIDTLKDIGKDLDLPIQEADETLPLPPASAQRFLKKRRDIPVVVVTDHQKEFTNKYYNSRFDSGNLIGNEYPQGMNESEKYNYVTHQAELITNLSSTLARYLYKASTGKNLTPGVKEKLTADSSTVAHLLYCFLISPNCELFAESVDEDNAKSLRDAKQPFPFYVSVDSHTNEVTQLVYNIMARFTGVKVNNTKDKCQSSSKDSTFSYTWMQGTGTVNKHGKVVREGWCIKSMMQYTSAVSPAFDIDGYNWLSGEYSTWTESRWGSTAIGVRLFLIPSEQFQAQVLVVGLLMLVVSLAVVYFCESRSSIIFGSRSPGSELVYNPMM